MVPCVRRRSCGVAEPLADVAHGGVQIADAAATIAGEDEAALGVVDELERRLGNPHAMALAVLGTGPAQ